MKNLLLQMGVKSRIEIIPNGVDLKRFRAPQSESERMNLRAKLGIDSKSQVILSIGAIHPRKGIDILLEAWVSLAKRFPDLHLYLIGMRHDLKAPKLSGFRNRLDALVRASNAVERVHFVGYIENVDEYLKAADVLVFPSRREGMPNAILEAMASGLPCVLTPFIGLSPDLGKAEHDYLLVDHDFKAIEDTVSNVLENHDLRIRLGVNGRKWVENTMDIQDVLDRYAQLYKNLSKLKV
jgi:glycosyltransferase involved in cell wall biosynthesis